jgi:hypothetical protein
MLSIPVYFCLQFRPILQWNDFRAGCVSVSVSFQVVKIPDKRFAPILEEYIEKVWIRLELMASV